MRKTKKYFTQAEAPVRTLPTYAEFSNKQFRQKIKPKVGQGSPVVHYSKEGSEALESTLMQSLEIYNMNEINYDA